jgi:ribosomal protein S18 acetylase RimI-like enzyme
MDARWMTKDDLDDVVAASALFDSDVRHEWARRFLEDPSHHLCIAYEDGEPSGFVSGVELTHPDKGTEMFLYELGVGEAFRGRGIGTGLVKALADLAAEHGCYGMWVLTEPDNEAALRTYTTGGAASKEDAVLLEWRSDQKT